MSVARVIEKVEGSKNVVVIRHDPDWNTYIVCISGHRDGYHTQDREDARLTARIIAGPLRIAKPLERRKSELFPRGQFVGGFGSGINRRECPNFAHIRKAMTKQLIAMEEARIAKVAKAMDQQP